MKGIIHEWEDKDYIINDQEICVVYQLKRKVDKGFRYPIIIDCMNIIKNLYV